MSSRHLLLVAALLAATAPAHAASPVARGEARLGKALAGRVAGAPVRCINLHDIRSSRIIDRTAILYDTVDGTLYVNRPDAGAATLDTSDLLVTDTRSPQLCDVDVVRLYDHLAQIPTGSVNLGPFIPYRRQRSD